MTDRKGLKTHKADTRWNPGPEARAILMRIMATAEKTDTVQVIPQINGKPGYFVYQDKLVTPIGIWRAFRLLMDGKTDAPESSSHRALESFKNNNASILTDADCIYTLKEWANGNW